MRFFDALPLPNADAATLVRAFSAFRELNGGATLTQFFTRAWERQPTAFYFDRQSFTPAWYMATLDNHTIVMIDGVSSQVQARAVMNGYEGVIQSGFRNPDNQWFTIAAQSIYDQLERLSRFSGEALTIVGWSLGGAIGARVPTLQQSIRESAGPIRVISFGAPRIGDEELARYCAVRASLTRYMAYNDPIPNYPPRAGTFTWVPFVVGIRASMRFTQFCHHAGGINIAEDGGFVDRATPTDGDITPSVALDVLWNGLAADSLSAHSVSNYSTLLDRGVPLPRPATGAVTVRHEHTQDVPVSEVHSQERGTLALVRELQQDQQSENLNIPRERLAYARRINRVWYVYWNDAPIMMTPTRRRAQGLARELNQFLRRMQSTAYVDPDALREQLQAFLQLASDSSSNIRPTLSTVLPT